jgi:hypothetical protein
MDDTGLTSVCSWIRVFTSHIGQVMVEVITPAKVAAMKSVREDSDGNPNTLERFPLTVLNEAKYIAREGACASIRVRMAVQISMS